MGDGQQRRNNKNFEGGLFAAKNIVKSLEKVFAGRHKLLFIIIVIIGILLMILPGGDQKVKKNIGDEEEKLSLILSEVEGCGNVSVMITYNPPEKYGSDTGQAKGAVVVAEGAGDISVSNKISEAVQAALNLPPHKVKVYKSSK